VDALADLAGDRARTPENRPPTAFRDVPETAILRPPAALGARASDDWA